MTKADDEKLKDTSYIEITLRLYPGHVALDVERKLTLEGEEGWMIGNQHRHLKVRRLQTHPIFKSHARVKWHMKSGLQTMMTSDQIKFQTDEDGNITDFQMDN